jgi:DnaJ-class molecular chaperone
LRLYDLGADGTLTLHLHDAQRRCWDSSARFTYFVAGTQSGKTFRMRGKGAPKLKGAGAGDLRIKAKVVVPETVTDKQRELLEEFAEVGGEDPRSHIK